MRNTQEASMTPEFDLLRCTMRRLLEHPFQQRWTYQGLGMLRLYLSDSLRLHIWMPSEAVEDVSTLHTHPWHFTSTVMSGAVSNMRYVVPGASFGEPWKMQRLHCGEGGGLKDKPADVFLLETELETYAPGDSYSQRAHEIHCSDASDGAVTIIKRSFLEDTEHADVFWKPGAEWISAEPREVTAREVQYFTQAALDGWGS